MVLLVDERPEEVTDMRRSVRGEVIDVDLRPSVRRAHQVAELAIERAKRLVEMGRDVVIILDGITRLAPGLQPGRPRVRPDHVGWRRRRAATRRSQFFGAARNIEEGGSLTILSTVLVETGSRMDEA